MNSEADYTLCNLDSHHGYPNAYGHGGTGASDIYGFHNINGRSSLDTGQACSAASYYGADHTSLSPQLGTPGELPLGSGGGSQNQLAGYGPGVLTARGTNRSHLQGYPHNIPAAHHPHSQQQQPAHHQQQQSHHQGTTHHHAGGGTTVNGGTPGQQPQHAHHPFSTHDLSVSASADCYTSSLGHSGQHHNLSTAPNFLEIASVRSGYHTSGLPGDTGKYGAGSPGPAHLVGTPVGLTNGYLPAPPPTSSPLKSEGCTNQQGLQGKPFRWMTIKRNPSKPGEIK